jgi:hypothetical protein
VNCLLVAVLLHADQQQRRLCVIVVFIDCSCAAWRSCSRLDIAVPPPRHHRATAPPQLAPQQRYRYMLQHCASGSKT